MVKCCFVPECTTGKALCVKQQKASGLKNKSLFKPPKVRKKNVYIIYKKKKILFKCLLHILSRIQSFLQNGLKLYPEKTKFSQKILMCVNYILKKMMFYFMMRLF